MRWLTQLFLIQPLATPARSAAAYVPWVMLSRALAFLRTLLVARLLGEAGKSAFGLYQPALEFINPLAALVMFGAADVAERYAAAMEKNLGPDGLRRWLHSQWLRLAFTGIGVAVLLYAGGTWISNAIWGVRGWVFVSEPGTIGHFTGMTYGGYSGHTFLLVCAMAITLLALYQHVAATLRGLRAYAASAGMELLGAILLLLLSTVAAWYWNPARLPYYLRIGTEGALWLILAYAASLAAPLLLYAILLNRHLRHADPATPATPQPPFHPGDILSYAPRWNAPRFTRFAAWALARLLLVLLFGFLSLWGVRYLAANQEPEWFSHRFMTDSPLASTAAFSIPFRIAQLLAFLAVTLWASTYGIAARAHSHGQTRRAHAQLFRVGRLGTAALTLLAAALLLARPLFAYALPAYAAPIHDLLPGMLALFLWYGMISFFSAYADLRESPSRGAALWATAVLFQIAGIALARLAPDLLAATPFAHLAQDPQRLMLTVSAAGLLAALLLTTPALLRRPFNRAAATPLALLTLAPLSLFAPTPYVNYLAPPILLATVLFLYFSGLLVRPMDRRAFKKWRTQ